MAGALHGVCQALVFLKHVAVVTGTPPRSPIVRSGIPSRLAAKPPLHGSLTMGSLTLSTLSVTEEAEER